MVWHIDPREESSCGDGVTRCNSVPDKLDNVVKHPGEDLLLQPLHLLLLPPHNLIVALHPVLHLDAAPAPQTLSKVSITFLLAIVRICLPFLPGLLSGTF